MNCRYGFNFESQMCVTAQESKKLNLRDYFNNIRACAHCSQLFGEIHLLCKTCWRALELEQNLAENFRQWDYGLPTYSLYSWRDQKQIQSLIYALKNGGVDLAFEFLAARFLTLKNLVEPPDYQNTLIVPAPSKVVGVPDHAYQWSFFLSQLSGARLCPVLLREDDRPQKSLTKQERLSKKMKLFKDLEILPQQKIVFADDVITSGGTAGAAFQALGSPQNFEVWTISCRPQRILI